MTPPGGGSLTTGPTSISSTSKTRITVPTGIDRSHQSICISRTGDEPFARCPYNVRAPMHSSDHYSDLKATSMSANNSTLVCSTSTPPRMRPPPRFFVSVSVCNTLVPGGADAGSSKVDLKGSRFHRVCIQPSPHVEEREGNLMSHVPNRDEPSYEHP